jgi:hypothetical protein
MDNQVCKFICLSNIPFDERLFLFREKEKLIPDGSNIAILLPPSEITNYDKHIPNLLDLCKEKGYQYKEIRYELPDWFLNFKGKRYVKIIGVHSNKFFKDNIAMELNSDGSFLYGYDGTTSDNPPSIATLHSNLASLTNLTGLKLPNDFETEWNYNWGDSLNNAKVVYDFNNNDTSDYVMTANQFFTPKIYQINDDILNEYKTIKFWFKDDKHKIFPVLSLFKVKSAFSLPGTTPPEIRTCELLEFRIEIELVCVSQIV